MAPDHGGGVAYSGGRGRRAVYGLTPERDLAALLQDDDEVALSPMLWLQLATRGECTLGALASELGVDQRKVDRAPVLRRGLLQHGLRLH